MTITMEVNDEEAANLLNRFAERGEVEVTGDTGGEVTATPTTSPAELGGYRHAHRTQWLTIEGPRRNEEH